MTASEESSFDALKASSERMVSSVVMIGAKVLMDPRVAVPAERVQSELRQAKAIGQLAVLTAAAKLKKIIQPDKDPVRGPLATPSYDRDAEAPTSPAGIPNYVQLSASQIIPLLSGLTVAERDTVLAYETATRQRKTILAALRKLVT